MTFWEVETFFIKYFNYSKLFTTSVNYRKHKNMVNLVFKKNKDLFFVFDKVLGMLCEHERLAVTPLSSNLHQIFWYIVGNHTEINKLFIMSNWKDFSRYSSIKSVVFNFDSSKQKKRPRSHCKFQEWQLHLNVGVSPVNYRSTCVRNSTNSRICNHSNFLFSCGSE